LFLRDSDVHLFDRHGFPGLAADCRDRLFFFVCDDSGKCVDAVFFDLVSADRRAPLFVLPGTVEEG